MLFNGVIIVPLLSFKCKNCGKKFDELVNNHNRDKLRCPDCGSNELVQVFEGKCYFGSTSGNGYSSSASCSGSCEHCHGCH